jgi:hypothetical protein
VARSRILAVLDYLRSLTRKMTTLVYVVRELIAA